MPTPSPTCHTCNGNGQPGGCPDCHGTPQTNPAPTPPLTPPALTTSSGRGWKFYAGIIAAVAVLGVLGFLGYKQFNKPSSATASASNGSSSASASNSSSANTDPQKPAPTASVATFKKPECPSGALWDTTKEVCVMLPPPVAFPSALTAEIKLPCPSACPSTSAVASASAPPKPVPVIPATIVVKPAKMRDISEVGDLAAFPSGN